MRAVEQWRGIEAQLDPDWEEIFLSFIPEDEGAVGEAAGALGPLGPLRHGRELRFQVSRHGAAPDRLRRLLETLDRKRVWGELSLVDVRVAERVERAAAAGTGARAPLAGQWDAEIGKLSPGWRDLVVELELDSTDFLAQAALVGAPLNPRRVAGKSALAFRVVEHGLGGYGTPPELTRRCLERMDEGGITGRLSVQAALADVDYVGTQGPVLRIAGRAS